MQEMASGAQLGYEVPHQNIPAETGRDQNSLFYRTASTAMATGMVALALASGNVLAGTAHAESSEAEATSLPEAHASRYKLSIPQGVAPPLVYDATKKAKAVVVGIHGGAWIFVGEGARDAIAPQAKRFQKAGIKFINIDYRAGYDGLKDVRSIVSQIEDKEDQPVCLYGQSAGATLATLTAQKDPAVSCVISEAGIYDLPAMESVENKLIPVYEGATKLFGVAGMAKMSPARQKWKRHTPLMLIGAKNDSVVPDKQLSIMDKQAPWAKFTRLSAGSDEWVHSNVNRTQLKAINKKQISFVTQSAKKIARH